MINEFINDLLKKCFIILSDDNYQKQIDNSILIPLRNKITDIILPYIILLLILFILLLLFIIIILYLIIKKNY